MVGVAAGVGGGSELWARAVDEAEYKYVLCRRCSAGSLLSPLVFLAHTSRRSMRAPASRRVPDSQGGTSGARWRCSRGSGKAAISYMSQVLGVAWAGEAGDASEEVRQ